jgi:pimeloyl-ACP methyl ester carboxylesterase/glycine cleavage system regulatory protein
MEAQVITNLPERARVKWHVDHMVTSETTVDGRAVSYAVGGRGLPVLFLHGWGLDHRAYQRTLRRLTARGCRVVAPSLPGFGGSAALASDQRSLSAHARWVARFLDSIDVDEPMVVLGHSFGGGVATKFAHDHPDRARYLVLLNSVGDPRGLSARTLAGLFDPRSNNPLVAASQVLLPTATGSTVRQLQRVFWGNVARDPLAVAQSAWLAWSADLAAEMAALADRQFPVLVLWSDRDGVIPMKAFDTFCSTFGADGQIVAGGHSWMLANPDVFGQVLDNVLHVQAAQHQVGAVTESAAQLESLLATTTMRRTVIRRLLDDVSPLWLLSAPPVVLAADLTLCHPRLGPGEVRAVARPTRSTNTYRFTVVAHDRAGLLADTAAILAADGITVVYASVMTWARQRRALHSLTVRSTVAMTPERWNTIGERLQSIAHRPNDVIERDRFVARGRVEAILTGQGDGQSVVRVTAPDQIGLLSAVCRWFAEHDVSVEAASIATVDGTAKDVFTVQGACDVDGLVRHLSGRGRSNPVQLLSSMWAGAGRAFEGVVSATS